MYSSCDPHVHCTVPYIRMYNSHDIIRMYVHTACTCALSLYSVATFNMYCHVIYCCTISISYVQFIQEVH